MNTTTIERPGLGMRVMSADGYMLGIVCRLIDVDAYTFVEVVSDRDVWKLALRPRRLFLPMNALAEVLGNYAVLRIDARAAKAYTAPPQAPARRAKPAAYSAGTWDWSGGWDWSGRDWSGGDATCGFDGGSGGDGGCGG